MRCGLCLGSGGRRLRAFGSAEPEAKSEARPTDIALVETFEKPVRLVLSQLAGSDRLVDLGSEIRFTRGLDGGHHGLQINTLFGGNLREGLAALQLG